MHYKEHVPLEFKVLEFNIEEANNGYFRFREFSSFVRDFKLKNLSPSEHERLINLIIKEDTVA